MADVRRRISLVKAVDQMPHEQLGHCDRVAHNEAKILADAGHAAVLLLRQEPTARFVTVFHSRPMAKTYVGFIALQAQSFGQLQAREMRGRTRHEAPCLKMSVRG